MEEIVNFFTIQSIKNEIVTWVDQKVLKLVAYLHKYMTELHQTYTEYATTIS